MMMLLTLHDKYLFTVTRRFPPPPKPLPRAPPTSTQLTKYLTCRAAARVTFSSLGTYLFLLDPSTHIFFWGGEGGEGGMERKELIRYLCIHPSAHFSLRLGTQFPRLRILVVTRYLSTPYLPTYLNSQNSPSSHVSWKLSKFEKKIPSLSLK